MLGPGVEGCGVGSSMDFEALPSKGSVVPGYLPS